MEKVFRNPKKLWVTIHGTCIQFKWMVRLENGECVGASKFFPTMDKALYDLQGFLLSVMEVSGATLGDNPDAVLTVGWVNVIIQTVSTKRLCKTWELATIPTTMKLQKVCV